MAEFLMAVLLLLFVLNDKKLSPEMDQISLNINSTNRNIYSYDQKIKTIVNLGSKKGDKNDNSSPQIS